MMQSTEPLRALKLVHMFIDTQNYMVDIQIFISMTVDYGVQLMNILFYIAMFYFQYLMHVILVFILFYFFG